MCRWPGRQQGAKLPLTCDVLVVVLLFELEPQLLVDLLEVCLRHACSTKSALHMCELV